MKLKNKIVFTTYFNQFYLRKAVLMYESIIKYFDHDQDIEFFFYCFDQESVTILEKLSLPRINIKKIDEVEHWFGINHSLFPERTYIEYMFTLTPIIVRHARSACPDASIIYVDSDYYFYSSPAELISQCSDYDMAFVMHDFPDKYLYLEEHGRFNVGWNYFSPSRSTTSALNRWCAYTVSWCHDRIENGKYADQKYLDYICGKVERFWPIPADTIGLAEYNFFSNQITLKLDDSLNIKEFKSNNKPIVAWHHHGVVENAFNSYSLKINIQEARCSDLYKEIYETYLKKLTYLTHLLIDMNLPINFGNSRLA